MIKREKPLEYPFAPTSNRRLIRGHYWGIDLVRGGWACGVVLGIDDTPRPGRNVQFIGGLLNWRSDDPPNVGDIADIGDYVGPIGINHVRTITETGGTINGWCDIHRPNMPTMIARTRVFDGVSFLRDATNDDWERYETLPGFNLGSLWFRANNVLGGIADDELQAIYRQLFGRA